MSGLYVYGESKRLGVDQYPLLPKITEREFGLFSCPSGEIECEEISVHYTHGDILWINGERNTVKCVLSRQALTNTLLLTEQCDNRCLFCSQPPNELPDSHLYERAALALSEFRGEKVVGITGGEPLLNRKLFLTLIETLNLWESPTPLHVLTNGRAFSDSEFTSSISTTLGNREVQWGIPLYSFKQELHDELVGAQGAFLETLEGLMNASAQGFDIELRIVMVKQNFQDLPTFLQFIATHLPSVGRVSVMQLEPKGWARKNFDALYVSPIEQGQYLDEALRIADLRGVSVELFNYPRCLLSEKSRTHAVKSISDWKNYFPEICNSCEERQDCGGLFTSAQGKFLESVIPL